MVTAIYRAPLTGQVLCPFSFRAFTHSFHQPTCNEGVWLGSLHTQETEADIRSGAQTGAQVCFIPTTTPVAPFPQVWLRGPSAL